MKIIKELNRVFPFDFVFRNKKLYYASYNLNGIFAFDMEKEKNYFLTEIPGECVMGGGGYYSGIDMIGDELLIAPDHASSFMIYNTKTQDLKKIPLPDTKTEYPVFSKFRTVIGYGKTAFCIPIRYPGLVEIDQAGNAILYSHEIIEKEEVLITAGCLFNRKIYMSAWNSRTETAGELLAFQVENKGFECIKMEYGKIYHICSATDGLWLVTEKGLVFWNIKENRKNCYDWPQKLNEKKTLLKIIYFENKVWIFTADGTIYTTFGAEKKEYTDIISFSNRVCHTHIINNYISAKVYDSKLFYFNASVGNLFVFLNGEKKEYKLEIPRKYLTDHRSKLDILAQERIEGDMIGSIWGQLYELNDYINDINSYEKKNSLKTGTKIGHTIFERLRESKK